MKKKKMKERIRIKTLCLYYRDQASLDKIELNQVISILLILYEKIKDLTHVSILHLSLL